MNKRPLLTAAFCAVLAAALVPALRAEDTALLKPGVTVKIPDSKGKFDFLEVDSVHHRLLAAHEKSGTADFIDLDSNTVITRLPVGPAVHMCLDPKTDTYFVSDSEEKKIVTVDAKTLKVTGEIPTEGELDALLYIPKYDRVYITHDEETHVWAVDPNEKKVIGTIEISGAPEYMVYDPASDRIYLNLKKANEVNVIDPSTNTIVAKWSTLPAGSPHGLAFDPATSRLFAAGGDGHLAAIDIKTGKVIASVEIAKGVDQAVFDPSTRRIYCAAGATWFIAQETDDGLKLLGNMPTPATAKNVAIDPANHSVWTTYTDGKDSFAQQWLP